MTEGDERELRNIICKILVNKYRKACGESTDPVAETVSRIQRLSNKTDMPPMTEKESMEELKKLIAESTVEESPTVMGISKSMWGCRVYKMLLMSEEQFKRKVEEHQ